MTGTGPQLAGGTGVAGGKLAGGTGVAGESVIEPPATTATLLRQWDASDPDARTVSAGDVTALDDRTGNTSGFVEDSGAAPTLTDINGRDALGFDGSTQWLDATTIAESTFMHNGSPANLSMFFVVQFDETDDPNRLGSIIGNLGGSFDGDYGTWVWWDHRDTIREGTVGAGISNGPNPPHIGHNTLANGEERFDGTTVALVEIHHTPGAATLDRRSEIIVNGGPSWRLNESTEAAVANAASHLLQLGAGGNDVYPFGGRFGEGLVYGQAAAMSEADRQAVRSYAASKWGVTIRDLTYPITAKMVAVYDPNMIDTVTESAGSITALRNLRRNGDVDMAQATPAEEPDAVDVNGITVVEFDGSTFLEGDTAADWTFIHDGSVAWVFEIFKMDAASADSICGLWGTNRGTNSQRGAYMRWDDRTANSLDEQLIASVSGNGATTNAAVIATSAGTAPIDTWIAVLSKIDANNGTIINRWTIAVDDDTAQTGDASFNGTVSGSAPAYPMQMGAVGNDVWPCAYQLAFRAFINGALDAADEDDLWSFAAARIAELES